MKILLVEDDPSTCDLLALHLKNAHYVVEQAADGLIGLELASMWNYDLILLDIQLPELDGISLCQKLRSQGISVPILMLTAQNEDADIVTGLDAGADDYVTKPFDVSQVLARIRALLRRSGVATQTPKLTWGDLCLDPAAAQVTYLEKIVTLTPKEYSLLELFLRYPRRVFSRSAILDHLWTIDDSPTESAVTNLVKDLRNRLKRSGIEENIIQTVYGLGYRLNEIPDHPVAKPTLSEETPAIASVPSLAQSAGQTLSPQVQGSIEKIAAHFLSSVQQRLMIVEDAVRALQAGGLAPPQQEIAREEAHRLAGGLGTFGYPEGSRQAKCIEACLKVDPPLSAATISQLSQSLLALKKTLQGPPTPAYPVTQRWPSPQYQLLAISLPPDLLTQLQAVSHETDWQISPMTDHRLAQSSPAVDPDAILLTLDASLELAQRLASLQAVKQIYPSTPVVVLTAQDSLEERVQVVRLGGDRYLVAPVSAQQVMEVLNQVLPQPQLPEARIMVVDQDPLTCASINHLLSPWGMQVTELGCPDKFWEVLRQTRPSLLIVELEMPTFSGMDLCQVVRQDPEYGNLPILILTANPNTVTIRQVFEAGGDDLISKPIVGPELVTRVLSRIERSQLRQQLEHIRQQQVTYWPQECTVPFPQMASRQYFDTFLQQQWQRHRQDKAPISVILCSVDNFDTYLEACGTQAGEQLQQQIAQTLQRTINPNIDLLAHYSQQEFGVVLPNTNLDGALRVMSRIQQTVRQLKIPHPAVYNGDWVTLSAGIGGAVPTASQSYSALLKTATQALKTAKARGGNTFCLYSL